MIPPRAPLAISFTPFTPRLAAPFNGAGAPGRIGYTVGQLNWFFVLFLGLLVFFLHRYSSLAGIIRPVEPPTGDPGQAGVSP